MPTFVSPLPFTSLPPRNPNATGRRIRWQMILINTYHSGDSWLTHKLLALPMSMTYSPERCQDRWTNHQPRTRLGSMSFGPIWFELNIMMSNLHKNTDDDFRKVRYSQGSFTYEKNRQWLIPGRCGTYNIDEKTCIYS